MIHLSKLKICHSDLILYNKRGQIRLFRFGYPCSLRLSPVQSYSSSKTCTPREGYAEGKSLEALQAQLAEVQSKLKQAQETNTDLKKRLASYENEITGWRLALENIEAEIAGMEE